MRPPVIVLDRDGCMEVFSSLDYAERYLEVIDVRNKEYVAFDSEGRRVEFVIEAYQESLFRFWTRTCERLRMRFSEAEPKEADVAELYSGMRERLERWGYVRPGANHSLDELIAVAQHVFPESDYP